MPIFKGSFKDKSLRDFYCDGTTKKLPIKNTDKLRIILDYINGIKKLPPSPIMYRAHEHTGKDKGTWSFDITRNMRVLCEFDQDNDPINIRIEDPH